MSLGMSKGRLSWWAKSNDMDPLKESFHLLIVEGEVREILSPRGIPGALVGFEDR